MKKLMKIALALTAMVMALALYGCKNSSGGGSPEKDKTDGGNQNVVTPDDADDEDDSPDSPAQNNPGVAYTAYSDFFDDGDESLGDVWEVSSKKGTAKSGSVTQDTSMSCQAASKFNISKITMTSEEFFDGLCDTLKQNAGTASQTVTKNELYVNKGEGKITHLFVYSSNLAGMTQTFDETVVFSKK